MGTKKEFENYLNDVMTEDAENISHIIHKIRNKRKLGSGLRKFDPIQFEVGYGEWARY